MKKLLYPTTFLLALLVLPISPKAQTVVEKLRVGVHLRDGARPATTVIASGDVSLYRDTTKGVLIVTEPGIIYANEDDDIQGGLIEVLAVKTLDIFSKSKLHFGMGSVLMTDVKDGEDTHDIGVNVMLGANIANWLGVTISGFYFPGSIGNHEGIITAGLSIAPPF